jgi:hypothetical protein
MPPSLYNLCLYMYVLRDVQCGDDKSKYSNYDTVHSSARKASARSAFFNNFKFLNGLYRQ